MIGLIAVKYRKGMRLSKREMRKLRALDMQYLANAWEVKRNKLIAKIQGTLDEFIK